jgi:hypothetical protein
MDNLRGLWDKITKLGIVGVLIKLALLLGAPTIVVILGFIFRGLVLPAILAIWYILTHLSQIWHGGSTGTTP